MKPYDLVIIGTGTAAMVAATRVRSAGWSVAVIDFRPFGGTCALRGCDPKKMLIGGAEALDHARRMRGKGLRGEVRIDWGELMAFKRSFTDPVPKKHEAMYASKGIDSYHGCARFTGRNTLKVDGASLEARYVLIAAGAEPVRPQIPGEEHVLTSEQFLELPELPARIVLVGGGYVAAELSHIAARAGAHVTVLQRGERMLTNFDPDLVGWLMERFGAIGVDVRVRTTVEAIMGRQKDIQYASRSDSHIARRKQIHRLRHVIRELAKNLPPEERDSPQCRELASWGCGTLMHIVRLLAPTLDSEDYLKDIDFSPGGIRARWRAGIADTQQMIERAPWEAEVDPMEGVIVHELSARTGMKIMQTA